MLMDSCGFCLYRDPRFAINFPDLGGNLGDQCRIEYLELCLIAVCRLPLTAPEPSHGVNPKIAI